MTEAIIDFPDDERMDLLYRIGLDPELTLEALVAVDNMRPYNSACTLALYFAERDVLAFRAKLTDCLSVLFAKVYNSMTVHGLASCCRKKVFKRLQLARDLSHLSVGSGDYTHVTD